MSDLISKNEQAQAWIEQIKRTHRESELFEKIVGSVIWSNATGPDGELLVPVDPLYIVDKINSSGLRLLKGHDPGFPLGRVLAAAHFTNSDNEDFVAAVLGFYGDRRMSFQIFSDTAEVNLPLELPALDNMGWINFGFDQREVDPAWVEDVLRTAPIPVKRVPLSHNAAATHSELIVLGVLFATLLFKPLITTVMTEAGKDLYAAIHKWMRSVFSRLSERKDPILEIQSFHGECQLSFILRGTDVKRHYEAHDALPVAAAKAERLIENMKRAGFGSKLVVYEYHGEGRWFPSYAELHDGRFVTDNSALIAVENLPSGLSLGLSVNTEKTLLPSVKRRLPKT